MGLYDVSVFSSSLRLPAPHRTTPHLTTSQINSPHFTTTHSNPFRCTSYEIMLDASTDRYADKCVTPSCSVDVEELVRARTHAEAMKEHIRTILASSSRCELLKDGK